MVATCSRAGVTTDLLALANTEDPFTEEWVRRAEELYNEEELLGILRDLVGQ